MERAPKNIETNTQSKALGEIRSLLEYFLNQPGALAAMLARDTQRAIDAAPHVQAGVLHEIWQFHFDNYLKDVKRVGANSLGTDDLAAKLINQGAGTLLLRTAIKSLADSIEAHRGLSSIDPMRMPYHYRY